MDLTQEQKDQMKTWAQIRDEQIALNLIEQKKGEELLKRNLELVSSNADLETRVKNHEAILFTADEVEKQRGITIRADIAALERSKILLEATVTSLKGEEKILWNNKETLKDDIKLLQDLHNKIFNKVSMLDKIVDHVVKTSEKNMEFLNKIVSQARLIVEMSDSIIDTKNKK